MKGLATAVVPEHPHHHQAPSACHIRLGAQVTEEGVHFRCWAPKPTQVEVVLEPQGTVYALTREADGHWTGVVPEASAGMTYRYRLDGGELYPDPCSRYQPMDPMGRH